jgi:hypothetical protein
VVPRDERSKSFPLARPTPWNPEHGRTQKYCSQTPAFVQFFLFRTHDRTPRKNKKGKKEKPDRSCGPGKEARACDGAVAGVKLDAYEAPSGELGC